LRLVEFLDSGFGEEDAAGGAGFGFCALDENTVEEGRERADGFECGCLGWEY